jgi:peptide/nickel transport system substrate-binding protein
VRLSAAPDCLDAAESSGGGLLQGTVFDTLVSYSRKGGPVPYLAQKYTVAKNSKSVTFYLRHDIKYSNGRQLVAADVKAELERVLNPATKSPALSTVASISSIVTSGKYIVKLNLKAPDGNLLPGLAVSPPIEDPSSVAAAGSNSCNGVAGSGPFKISSVGPALSTVTEVRNPRHTFEPVWATNRGPAYLSSITWSAITSNTTAVSELLSGQLDITDVSGSELSRVQGNKNFKLYRVPSTFVTFLLFNRARKPFNNPAVRWAVAEAIDRKAVMTAATQGLGRAVTSVLAPTDPDYDPGSAKYAPKLNVSAARAAIAAAGATGPYTLLAESGSFSGSDFAPAAELIQGELAQVGMQVNIVSKSPADFFPAAQKGDFDMALMCCQVTTFSLSFWFHSGYPGNVTKMTEVDHGLDVAKATLDFKKQRAYYYQVQKLMDMQIYADPLWVPVTAYAVRSRIQGWHTQPGPFGYVAWQDLWVK